MIRGSFIGLGIGFKALQDFEALGVGARRKMLLQQVQEYVNRGRGVVTFCGSLQGIQKLGSTFRRGRSLWVRT